MIMLLIVALVAFVAGVNFGVIIAALLYSARGVD